MSVSAETYIVIALMFAVFSAVAAVGTSVVLGAGFERLRLGFEIVKKQTGFFSDAIYKLDQKTQKLDEETQSLKAGIYGMGERVARVEKRTDFVADAINSIEMRILQGSPSQPAPVANHDAPRVQMEAMLSDDTGRHGPVTQRIQVSQEWQKSEMSVFDDGAAPGPQARNEVLMDDGHEDHDSAGGLGTLLSRYFLGDNDKGVIYH